MKITQSYISLSGAQFFAHHGVTQAEQAVGGRYSVDLRMQADVARAAATDALADTVDYAHAWELARQVLLGSGNRHLLESLAADIARAVLHAFPAVGLVTVRLRKLDVPVDGPVDAAEVELTGSREPGEGDGDHDAR